MARVYVATVLNFFFPGAGTLVNGKRIVLGLLWLAGVIGLTVQSRRMAESAIRENTAATVAQGYLEQIKSVEYSALEDAIADPTTIAIPTKTDQDTNDPILLNVFAAHHYGMAEIWDRLAD